MTASPVLLAVALSLISAVCYATAAVVQERTAAATPGMRGALARGAWWGSVALNAGGALLHVVALRYGPLTLVQPLGALSLVLAVPLGSLATGRRTSGTQWRGVAYTLVGLSTLLLVTATGGAPHATLGTAEVMAVALFAAGAVAVLVSVGTGGLAFAAASGIASGVGSTLSQKLAVGPTVSWDTALVGVLTVGFAVGGLLLSQQAYRSGLGGPLALLTLINPVTASAIGIALLGEGFQYGSTGTLLALAGGAAAVYGVTLLSRTQETPSGPTATSAPQIPSTPPTASTGQVPNGLTATSTLQTPSALAAASAGQASSALVAASALQTPSALVAASTAQGPSALVTASAPPTAPTPHRTPPVVLPGPRSRLGPALRLRPLFGPRPALAPLTPATVELTGPARSL
ncbi:DMT family protein [Streptomyces justiciae]|uniref:Integral membrane protein n=1 Tax=Streptomyces justiciae TaxID=2780140 RepID=A0ABU3M3R7_9ACTN|nr:hypothetical protein [Streptomyces justiciae]MDT7846147.1 hypothetical protein [Streptomyces justiciae]